MKKIETMEVNHVVIAVITGDEKLITDVNSALDLIMTVKYDTGAERIAICKEAVAEDFFILSTGMAGEILQKFVNYQIKFAVYGDYSQYTSKPLKDFIYESNHGSTAFFVNTKEEAVAKLAEPE